MLRPKATWLTQGPAGAEGLRHEEFSAQFTESFRVLWLIAAGILGNSDLADDVVQEAAVIALRKLDDFTPGTSFTAWTGQIVRNVALNRARGERRRKIATTGPDVLGAIAQTTGEATDPANVRIDRRILAALESVGETARACLLLRTLENMEYSEISQLLEIPEGTAMSHVHRTRAYLRDRLADLWAERTGEKEARV